MFFKYLILYFMFFPKLTNNQYVLIVIFIPTAECLKWLRSKKLKVNWSWPKKHSFCVL